MKYRAVCGQCYSAFITKNPAGVSKRDAEVEAVSHMNAYGHRTWIQEVDATSKAPKETK